MTPTDTMPQPLLLKAADVGKLLQLSRDQVRNLHRCGRLPGMRIGKVLRWRPADVVEFVEKLGIEK